MRAVYLFKRRRITALAALYQLEVERSHIS
jgi:hypothetical protein